MESVTVEQTLPGLGAPDGQVAGPDVARTIGLTPSKRLMLVSGRSNPELAHKIALQIGCELGETTLKTFASGETYCRYEDSIRGADIFIVQTGTMPVDQHLMELLIMINAAKLASAKRITAVIPWYFYVRQDKKSRPREPITAKLVADLLADGRRRSGPHDGSPRGAGPGLLRDSGGSHDRRADVRAVRA